MKQLKGIGILLVFYLAIFAYANRKEIKEEIKIFFWSPEKDFTVVNNNKKGGK